MWAGILARTVQETRASRPTEWTGDPGSGSNELVDAAASNVDLKIAVAGLGNPSQAAMGRAVGTEDPRLDLLAVGSRARGRFLLQRRTVSELRGSQNGRHGRLLRRPDLAGGRLRPVTADVCMGLGSTPGRWSPAVWCDATRLPARPVRLVAPTCARGWHSQRHTGAVTFLQRFGGGLGSPHAPAQRRARWALRACASGICWSPHMHALACAHPRGDQGSGHEGRPPSDGRRRASVPRHLADEWPARTAHCRPPACLGRGRQRASAARADRVPRQE
jgi:hypothetical protein